MTIHFEYSNYANKIKSVKIEIGLQQYLKLIPDELTVIVDGEELVEKSLLVEFYDDNIMYSLLDKMDRNDIAQMSKILQVLNTQLSNDN